VSIYRLMREETKPPALAGIGAPLRGHEGERETKSPKSPQDVADILTKYLPAEVVVLYTAILPFLVPKDTALNQQDFTSRWLVAAIVAVIALIYAVGLYRRGRRAAHKDFQWHVAVGKSATVLVAYVAWVCLVPGSPFNAFHWYTPSTGAVIGLLAGGALGALAVLFES
jgi:uncharacterized membrane protein YozB (DUF420 family)